ncbi:Acyl-CoA dehydrogenase OS=Stutzerimonas stutzeri OX=316 GN=E5834_20850 PE=3 SV=1 [Stutzerimonas stutzeri]
MTPNKTEELSFIREGVRALCAEFPAEYWRRIDEEKGFPEDLRHRHDRGRLAVGDDSGRIRRLGPAPGPGASVILEEATCCGGNSGTIHGQMYNMFTLL